ncbi:MAG: dUTP pyrophosphatase [Clostridia bacterium]|nr:dUTP pyrophosphatase [Clostridia bacterium]
MIKVTENEIYFAKMREGARIPTKRDEDAGYDLYPCFEGDYFVIKPGETRAVPTGIAMAFDKKYYVQIEERSSMAKIGIKKSGGVMDSGYRGEYLIMTYNTLAVPFVISKIAEEDMPDIIEENGVVCKKGELKYYPYSKAICQAVMQIVPQVESKEISYEELISIESERKTGGFGSSKK